jgi:hypothetical protein
MTDCVDAAVEAVQLPSTDTERDPFGSETRVFKLTSSSYSMLARSNRSHVCICRVAFCVHMDA